jgi:ubiquitin C-terminal hydrolase
MHESNSRYSLCLHSTDYLGLVTRWQDVQLRNGSIPVKFHFEKCDWTDRLSVAVYIQELVSCDGHHCTTVRTESNNWYMYDHARVKAIGNMNDVREVTNAIYFWVFERL